MGGELGSLVASLLEAEPWVGQLVGIDVDPPRRRLRKAEFHRIEPSNRDADRRRRHQVRPARADPPRGVGARRARRHRARASSSPTDAATPIIGAAAECPVARVASSCAAASRSTAGHATRSPDRTSPSPSTRRRSSGGWSQRSRQSPRVVGARGRASPSARCGSRRCSGPHVPEPARPPAAPAGGAVQRARRPPVHRGRGSRRGARVRRRGASVGSTSRSTSSRPARSPRCRPSCAAGAMPMPLVGPEWALARRL